MIGQRNPTLFLKPFSNGLDFLSRQTINNTGVVGVMFLNKLPKLLFGLACLGNRIKNIVSVKTIQINIGLLQIELLNEILNRIYKGAWNWPDTVNDIALTIFWQTVCYLVSTFERPPLKEKATIPVVSNDVAKLN